MNANESKSEVARLMRRITLEHQAARYGLTGLAYGTARHDFITARMELGAECILRLITEGKHNEAVALMNTEMWGVEVEEEQEGAGDGKQVMLNEPLYQLEHTPRNEGGR